MKTYYRTIGISEENLYNVKESAIFLIDDNIIFGFDKFNNFQFRTKKEFKKAQKNLLNRGICILVTLKKTN